MALFFFAISASDCPWSKGDVIRASSQDDSAMRWLNLEPPGHQGSLVPGLRENTGHTWLFLTAVMHFHQKKDFWRFNRSHFFFFRFWILVLNLHKFPQSGDLFNHELIHEKFLSQVKLADRKAVELHPRPEWHTVQKLPSAIEQRTLESEADKSHESCTTRKL